MQLDILPSPQVYQIFDVLHLRGTINWSFNICFIFFYLMWWGELFTFEFSQPKQLEFISHSHLANHAAYHMLRFVNTIHKPLLVYVCMSIPDTSRAVTNFGLILFMLVSEKTANNCLSKLYYFTIECRVGTSTSHLHSSHDLLYMVVHIGHVDSLPHVRWYVNSPSTTSHLQYADELYSLYLKVRARTLRSYQYALLS